MSKLFFRSRRFGFDFYIYLVRLEEFCGRDGIQMHGENDSFKSGFLRHAHPLIAIERGLDGNN